MMPGSAGIVNDTVGPSSSKVHSWPIVQPQNGRPRLVSPNPTNGKPVALPIVVSIVKPICGGPVVVIVVGPQPCTARVSRPVPGM